MYTIKLYVERKSTLPDDVRHHPHSNYDFFVAYEAEWFRIHPDPEKAKEGYNRYVVAFRRPDMPHDNDEAIVGAGIDEYQRCIIENRYGKTTEMLGA